MSNWVRLLGCLGLALVLAGCEASADVEPAKDKGGKSGGTPKEVGDKALTHKVHKGPFKIEVSVKGTFESEQMAEVAVSNLETWTPQTGGTLIVKRAVEQGASVRKGEPILWLDLEKIGQAIRDLESDRALAELGIKQAQEELPLLEKSTPRELAAAERARKLADEDLDRFLKVDRPLAEKSAHFMVKNYKNYLEYVKEELRQLEKMYRAKDLTEDTEEIILKRQRNMVEQYAFYVTIAEMDRDEMLQVLLPRREVMLRDNAVRQTQALAKANATLPLALTQKKLTLEKMTYDREKAATRLERLKRDRENMTVKAPADGIVYYGRCVNGQWTTASMMTSRLQRGALLQGEDVLMTIVGPKPLFVRAAIEEKDLQHLRQGIKGKVVPTAFPDLKLPAGIDILVPVPLDSGKFSARIKLDSAGGTEGLMPGMACAIKFVPYFKDNALTVPTTALFTDEADEERHYVYLAGKDGKAEKRYVSIGRKADRKVEILKGLNEGDEILLDKPGEGKKSVASNTEVTP